MTATRLALGPRFGINVFPDVMDAFDAKVRLRIKYNIAIKEGKVRSVSKDHQAEENEEVQQIFVEGHRAKELQLTPSILLHPPAVQFSRFLSENRKYYHPQHDSDPVVYYTLLLVDPDEPMRRINSSSGSSPQRLYWMVGNIPDSDFEQGETLASYLPPVPAFGTRLHRFVFVLMEQKKGRVDYSDFTKLDSSTLLTRDGFNVKSFAEKYQLLGRGISAFQAEWDSSVSTTFTSFADVEKEPRYMSLPKWRRFLKRLTVDPVRYIMPWGSGVSSIPVPTHEIRRISESD